MLKKKRRNNVLLKRCCIVLLYCVFDNQKEKRNCGEIVSIINDGDIIILRGKEKEKRKEKRGTGTGTGGRPSKGSREIKCVPVACCVPLSYSIL